MSKREEKAHSKTTEGHQGPDRPNVRIHETAEVDDNVIIGEGTAIWHLSQVREGATLGENCILGKNVYVDAGVIIGRHVKIQNNSSLYHGTTLGDGVFIGPHVICTNDKNPRAINPDGSLKTGDDWSVGEILIMEGAAVGAGSVILPGVTLGRFCLIGAGSVVTRDVPDFAKGYGVPFDVTGYVCKCGMDLSPDSSCETCGMSYDGENPPVE